MQDLKLPLLTRPIPAHPGSKKVTADWLLNKVNPYFMMSLSDVKWVSNSLLVYSLPSHSQKQPQTIQLLDIETKQSKNLAIGEEPLPSPDGRKIVFGKDMGDQRQLWIMNSDGSDCMQLTFINGGIQNHYNCSFAWDSSSKYLAICYRPHQISQKDNDNRNSINGFVERLTPAASNVEIIEISTRTLRHLATIDASLRKLSWFPDGEHLLFIQEREAFTYRASHDTTLIQSLRVSDAKLHTLVTFDGLQQFLDPVISSDGKEVAFMYDADNPTFNYMTSIGIVKVNFSHENIPIKRLTHEIKFTNPKWALNQKHIYVLRCCGAYKQLYTVNINTGAVRPLTNVPVDIKNYTLSPDGKQIAWVGLDAHGTQFLRIAKHDGTDVQDLVKLKNIPENMAISEIREIDWNTRGYPQKMRGLLVMPLNYHSGKKYPLIVDIHGGGPGAHIYLTGGILINSPLEWQLWSAKGYAVFIPEFRSSAAFGSLAISRDYFQEHDILNKDGVDIISGIDNLITQGIVDENRIALIGHSAGSVRVNWLAVTTHRFKAIISKEGLADNYYSYFLNAKPLERLYAAHGGSPSEVPQNYIKNSAIAYSVGATTPTLFLMGNPKLGGMDTTYTTKLLYNSLKDQCVETEYIEYLDEGHVFMRQENRKNCLERSIKWIDSHFGL